jgi:hypothetical protein
METYAARIKEGVVVQVIVGDADWASNALGGLWIDSDVLVGNGWLWDGEKFTEPEPPPPEPEPEPPTD